MAQQSIGQDILDIVGEALSGDLGITTAMLDDFVQNAAKVVFRQLPIEAFEFIGIQESAFAPTTGITVDSMQVINVLRSDSNSIDRKCIRIPESLAGAATEPGSLHKATNYSPVYFVKPQTSGAAKILILPSSTSSVGKLIHVSYPSIDTSTATVGTITGYPDELGDLLIWYAVATVRYRESGLMRRNAQDEIDKIITASTGYLADFEGALNPFTFSTTAIDDAIDKARDLVDDSTGMSVGDSIETIISQEKLQKASTQRETANTEIGRARASIEEQLAELRASGSDTQIAVAYLEEAKTALGVTGDYLNRGQVALKEAGHYMEMFNKELNAYLMTFPSHVAKMVAISRGR